MINHFCTVLFPIKLHGYIHDLARNQGQIKEDFYFPTAILIKIPHMLKLEVEKEIVNGVNGKFCFLISNCVAGKEFSL